MKELTLSEIKQIEFEILQYFKQFCEANGIRYFLSNGTLLGAIKYKGFIPWDDDIDVFVPRKDYNQLMRSFKDNDRFKLFDISRNLKYRFPYAKLCDMQTKKVEKGFNNGIQLGIDIDIFPLDFWVFQKENQQLGKSLKLMSYLACSKIKFSKNKNTFKTVLVNVWIAWWHFYGARRICVQIQNNALKGTVNKALYSGCVVWPIYGEYEIIPVEVFADSIEVEFEGEKFPAPIGYDTYLRSLYGTYELDPPLDKQKTHHNFVAYQL